VESPQARYDVEDLGTPCLRQAGIARPIGARPEK